MNNKKFSHLKEGLDLHFPNTVISRYKKPQYIGKRTRYYLGKKFSGVYLTAQEAKCLHYLILKYTSKKTAVMLKINFRTVEYYRENIRCKVGAVSKKDLLDKIKGTDFMDYVQHIEKICKDYCMSLKLK